MSRAAVLQNVRQSLGRGELDSKAKAQLQERLQQPPITLQPQLQPDDLLARFRQQLEKVAGTMDIADSEVTTVAAIQKYLQAHGFATQLVADRRLQGLPWTEDLTVAYRNAEGSDRVSITQAFLGIAETGSVMMLSSPEAPTPLNFLPDVHIVVLQQAAIVKHLEEAWKKLRATGIPPRTVNLITGPSRTADIEQTIQLGAHGPRAFHVVVVR